MRSRATSVRNELRLRHWRFTFTAPKTERNCLTGDSTDEHPERCDRLQLNEQCVLGAFLLGDPPWEVLLPVRYCFKQGLLPESTSFRMRKICG